MTRLEHDEVLEKRRQLAGGFSGLQGEEGGARRRHY